jgi:hypothetical protein
MRYHAAICAGNEGRGPFILLELSMAEIEFLTEQDVAERLNVKPATVREWRRLGRIPAVKVSHKVVRYVWADIVDSIAQRQDESGVAHVG